METKYTFEMLETLQAEKAINVKEYAKRLFLQNYKTLTKAQLTKLSYAAGDNGGTYEFVMYNPMACGVSMFEIKQEVKARHFAD
jgi:hypothetical protein